MGDFDSYSGRDLLLEAVKYTRESDSVRVCAIHSKNVGAKDLPNSKLKLSEVVQVAQSTLPSPIARQFLVKILDAQFSKDLIAGVKTLDDVTVKGFDAEAFKARLDVFNSKVFSLFETFISKVVGLPSGSRLVIANGRVLGPFDSDEMFVVEDFALLEKYTAATITDKIVENLGGFSSDLNAMSRIVMKVSGVIQTKSQSKVRTEIDLKGTEHSTFTIPANNPDGPTFQIVAVIDPVSQAAQKVGPILKILHQILNADITVVLNAVEKHSEMPLKNFHRVVIEPHPQ